MVRKIRTVHFKLYNMNWIILIIGGLFEVAFATCLGKAKEATGNAVFWWYAGFVACIIMSMLFLMKAIQTLPIGTAYAVWTGIGAVGTVIVGILVFNDPVSFWRIFFIVTLIGSIVGLKFLGH
jgi:quaternary ammonium compound-resistance protein SugE